MARRLTLFAVLLTALVGCGKSNSSTGDAPKGDPGTSGDSFVIKIREKNAGERYEVTRTRTESKLRFLGNGKGQEPAAPSVEKVTTKAVYIEEVEAVDGGAVTKGKRKYTVAEGEDFGKTMPLAFVGKTVAFEDKGGRFEFTLDGKAVPMGPESFALEADSDRNRLKGLGGLVPEAAVKVGESWEVPADKLATIFGPEGKAGGLKMSGKLEKAYTKNGMQFGVLTIRIEDGANDGGPRMTAELTYDGCIDGSVTESTRKSVETIKVPAGGPGAPALPDLVNSTERTIKPAK